LTHAQTCLNSLSVGQ